MRANRAAAGESRSCPHCKATILKSSASCPICRHVLRFAGVSGGAQPAFTACPLSVEGTIKHAGEAEAIEYCILIEVHDEAGKLVSRQSLGVGALQRTEERKFSFRVELSPVSPA